MQSEIAGKRAGIVGSLAFFLSTILVLTAALAGCAQEEPGASPAEPVAGTEPAAGSETVVPDSEQSPDTEPATPPPTPPPAIRLHTLEPGTSVALQLDQDVISGVALVGDPVTAQVIQAVSVDDRIVIPVGSKVEGSVTEVKPAKRFGGQAMVTVRFDAVLLPSGDAVLVEGSMSAYAKKETAKDAGTIAGGTAGGALLGKVLGDGKKDTAVGAVVGGAIATAIASRKGDEAFLPAGSEAVVVTREQVRVPPAL